RSPGFRWQLAWLPHRGEPGADAIRHRRSKNEPTTLDADHELDVLVAERLGETVNRQSEPRRVLQQRRDVVEEDARLGKVGHAANAALQLLLDVGRHHHVGPISLVSLGDGLPGTSPTPRQSFTQNPVARPSVPTSVTSTRSTRAPGGPCRTARSNRLSVSASP